MSRWCSWLSRVLNTHKATGSIPVQDTFFPLVTCPISVKLSRQIDLSTPMADVGLFYMLRLASPTQILEGPLRRPTEQPLRAVAVGPVHSLTHPTPPDVRRVNMRASKRQLPDIRIKTKGVFSRTYFGLPEDQKSGWQLRRYPLPRCGRPRRATARGNADVGTLKCIGIRNPGAPLLSPTSLACFLLLITQLLDLTKVE